MCSNACMKLRPLFWIGTKLLIVFGTLSFLADVGTDVSFSVQLFSNCHVKTGIASLCFILISTYLSMIIPSLTAKKPEERGFDPDPGCLLKYLILNWKEFKGDELDVSDKKYMHSVKFIETINESVPQIGISFYIIHHYKLSEPVFKFDNFGIAGDLQFLSLVASFVSINISMATRRAWWKMDGKPPSYTEIFKCFLWNFFPISCFLIAYCIIMADSSLILIIFVCITAVSSALGLYIVFVLFSIIYIPFALVCCIAIFIILVVVFILLLFPCLISYFCNLRKDNVDDSEDALEAGTKVSSEVDSDSVVVPNATEDQVPNFLQYFMENVDNILDKILDKYDACKNRCPTFWKSKNIVRFCNYDARSMSSYLASNTFIMAILHTIQVYVLGFENDESLLVNSFDICKIATTNNTLNEDGEIELNYVSSHPRWFIGIIWSAVVVAVMQLIMEAIYASPNERKSYLKFVMTISNEDDKASDFANEDVEMQENIQPKTQTKEDFDNSALP